MRVRIRTQKYTQIRGACTLRIHVQDSDASIARRPAQVRGRVHARMNTPPAAHEDGDAEEDGGEDPFGHPHRALLHLCEWVSAHAYHRSLEPARLVPRQVDAGITGTRNEVGARVWAKAGTRARARAKAKAVPVPVPISIHLRRQAHGMRECGEVVVVAVSRVPLLPLTHEEE
ncbi:hypothetical protein B0H13DRAFT_1894662 [Mycena leptocephala]|nr:hypothetical protein B0H13DRAFT_1894662 [Mycena leptocephala]